MVWVRGVSPVQVPTRAVRFSVKDPVLDVVRVMVVWVAVRL